jgi:hypothetical protein
MGSLPSASGLNFQNSSMGCPGGLQAACSDRVRKMPARPRVCGFSDVAHRAAVHLAGWDYCGPLFDNGNHAGFNGWTIEQLLGVTGNAVAVHRPGALH